MAETQIALRETIKSPMETLSVSIPADAKDKDVLDALARCCAAEKKIRLAAAHIYWVTGQVLKEVRRRKSYKEVASGFREFLTTVAPEKYGLEKTKAYDMIRFVEIYEQIPIRELLPINITALNRASQVIKKIKKSGGDASLTTIRKIVKQSAELAKEDFNNLHKAEAHGGVGRSIIRVATTGKVRRDFDRRIGDANREAFFKWLNSADDVWALWEAHSAKE